MKGLLLLSSDESVFIRSYTLKTLMDLMPLHEFFKLNLPTGGHILMRMLRPLYLDYRLPRKD